MRLEYLSGSDTFPGEPIVGRPIVTVGQTNINKMVPESVNMQLYLPDDGTTHHRSFCDTAEQQTTTVCVSNSGQQGPSNRCQIHELGRDSRICVSPVSHHSSDPHQVSHASMQNSVDRSSLASENLVSRVTSSVDSCTNISSGNFRVFNSKNRNRKLRASSPKSPNAFSSRFSRSVTDRNFSQSIGNTFLKQEDLLYERYTRQNGAYYQLVSYKESYS